MERDDCNIIVPAEVFDQLEFAMSNVVGSEEGSPMDRVSCCGGRDNDPAELLFVDRK